MGMAAVGGTGMSAPVLWPDRVEREALETQREPIRRDYYENYGEYTTFVLGLHVIKAGTQYYG